MSPLAMARPIRFKFTLMLQHVRLLLTAGGPKPLTMIVQSGHPRILKHNTQWLHSTTRTSQMSFLEENDLAQDSTLVFAALSVCLFANHLLQPNTYNLISYSPTLLQRKPVRQQASEEILLRGDS
jgi:hypothetical protein